jgi:PqqD family protein of HPr-rel-A system
LLHRVLEQEVFIFNSLTGHTHILNDIAWKLLTACADKARSSEYLLDLMDPESGEIDRSELQDRLLGHLEQLQQLDLIQQLRT